MLAIVIRVRGLWLEKLFNPFIKQLVHQSIKTGKFIALFKAYETALYKFQALGLRLFSEAFEVTLMYRFVEPETDT